VLIFIKHIVNKHKHDLSQFRNENFTQLLEQVKTQGINLDTFNKKHIRYVSQLQQRYEIANSDVNKQYEQLLTDIVIFNELFTTK
jgi:hypothetical protein